MNGFVVDPEVLRQRSPELAGVADEIDQIGPVVTATLSDADMLVSAVLSPVTALEAERAVLHAVTNGSGLGLALGGNAVADAADGIGTALGSHGLAEHLAADAVLMRISAVTYETPELANHAEIDRLVQLLAGSRQLAAAHLVANLADAETLGDLAPVVPELLALAALLDENPLNDPVGWDIVRGDEPRTDPVLGLDLDWLAGVIDPGPGHATPVGEPPGVVPQADTRGGLDNIRALGNTGQVLVQVVRGTDGTTRYAVLLPGMRMGPPVLPSPQDLSGAVRNVALPDSPYTGAVRQAMAQFGVPEGAEVLLIGYSAGGVAAANLAQDPTFNGGTYRVTDVLALAAPVDAKTVPDGSGTRVVTVTNDRDIVPTLDGRGPGSPEPVTAGRTEIRLDSTGLRHPDDGADLGAFPDSHGLETYAALLAGTGEDGTVALDALDTRIAPYAQGEVVAMETYQLSDHPPQQTP